MRRIQRDICHAELITRLTSGDNAIFKQIWQLLLFAAALGVKEDGKRPINTADTGKAIDDKVFSAPGWKGFLYLIRIVETKNSECLKNSEEEEEKLIKDFEEHANFGLHFLKEKLKFVSDDLTTFIEMLMIENEGIVEPQLERI